MKANATPPNAMEEKIAAWIRRYCPSLGFFEIAAVLTFNRLVVHYLPFAPFRVAAEFGVRRPVSPAIIAILLGAVARNVLRLPHVILEGCKGIVRKIIPVTIVLTGFSLNLASIEKVGARALVIILACIGVATGSAYVFGRMLKLWRRTALLIGAGTASAETAPSWLWRRSSTPPTRT